jgi:hypothetical protein
MDIFSFVTICLSATLEEADQRSMFVAYKIDQTCCHLCTPANSSVYNIVHRWDKSMSQISHNPTCTLGRSPIYVMHACNLPLISRLSCNVCTNVGLGQTRYVASYDFRILHVSYHVLSLNRTVPYVFRHLHLFAAAAALFKFVPCCP